MGRERLRIDAVSGYAPLVGRHLAMLEDVRARTLAYAAGLTAEQLSWHPDPKVESIGTQLLHIAAVEFSYIQEDVLKREMGEEWKAAFPIHFRMPQLKGRTLDFYAGKLAEVRAGTRGMLAELTDSDLARVIQPPGDADASVEYTIEWILYHLAEHEAHHKGQIALLKRLLPM